MLCRTRFSFSQVILALCASIILLVLVIYVLWRRQPAVVSGAGVLEIMWFGSRSRFLRNRLSNVQTPSLDSLRASSMFETVFWTRSTHTCEGSSDLYGDIPFFDNASRSGSLWFSRPGACSDILTGCHFTRGCDSARKSPSGCSSSSQTPEHSS